HEGRTPPTLLLLRPPPALGEHTAGLPAHTRLRHPCGGHEEAQSIGADLAAAVIFPFRNNKICGQRSENLSCQWRSDFRCLHNCFIRIASAASIRDSRFQNGRIFYKISKTSYFTPSDSLSPTATLTILFNQPYFGDEVSKNGAVRR